MYTARLDPCGISIQVVWSYLPVWCPLFQVWKRSTVEPGDGETWTLLYPLWYLSDPGETQDYSLQESLQESVSVIHVDWNNIYFEVNIFQILKVATNETSTLH